MSKAKIKKRKINAALCRGCNQWKRPNRVKMVDPRVIGIEKAPVALCARCRSKLVWKPVERPAPVEEKHTAKERELEDLAAAIVDIEDSIEKGLKGNDV